MKIIKTLTSRSGYMSIIFEEESTEVCYVHYLNPWMPGEEVPEEELEGMRKATNHWCSSQGLLIEKEG